MNAIISEAILLFVLAQTTLKRVCKLSGTSIETLFIGPLDDASGLVEKLLPLVFISLVFPDLGAFSAFMAVNLVAQPAYGLRQLILCLSHQLPCKRINVQTHICGSFIRLPMLDCP